MNSEQQVMKFNVGVTTQASVFPGNAAILGGN